MVIELNKDFVFPIDLAPETREEEIAQNIQMIVCTVRGSAPMARAFGLDQSFLDMPTQAARARMTGALIDAIERYEPRAKVLNAEILAEMEKVRIRLEVTIRE